jgi:hypothetical protein
MLMIGSSRISVALGLSAFLIATPAAAQFNGPTLAQPSPAAKKKALAADKPAKACPEYGAGYVRIEGTGTCMKVGGYLRFQAGANSR